MSSDMFMTRIETLLGVCSVGGAKYMGKPSTYMDKNHPGFVVWLNGEFNEDDVSTGFFVKKGNLYASCFTHDRNDVLGKNWVTIRESSIKIVGSDYAQFDITYGTSNGPALDGSLAYLENSLGSHVILSALYQLKYGGPISQTSGFHAICHNILEVARLTIIANVLRNAIDSGTDTVLEVWMIEYFRNWGSLSGWFRAKVLGSPQDIMEAAAIPLPVDDDIPQTEEDSNFYRELASELHLTDFRQLEESLKILNVEMERDRSRRRGSVRDAYGTEKYYRTHCRVIDMGIVKKDPCWKAKGALRTVEGLKDYRERELQRLIYSGGSEDIWRRLFDAIWERDMDIMKAIVDHIDINLQARDLSDSRDDKGFRYRFPKELLCNPQNMLS